MKEIKEIIGLLELNMQIMSQIPSVLKRTEAALFLAQQAQKKIDTLQKVINDQKYENDVLTVHQIKKALDIV